MTPDAQMPGSSGTDADFRARVLTLVARIPPGRVMTYGQLALLAGAPGAARQAGHVMQSLMGETTLPWHRVINAQGRVSTHKLGFGDLQEGLLAAEGVAFVAGRCDLARDQWWPEEPGAAAHAPPERLL